MLLLTFSTSALEIQFITFWYRPIISYRVIGPILYSMNFSLLHKYKSNTIRSEDSAGYGNRFPLLIHRLRKNAQGKAMTSNKPSRLFYEKFKCISPFRYL